MTQEQLNKLIARYVVENMQPLSTVESPALRQLVSKIPCPGGQQMARKTFSNYLDSEYAKMENKLKKTSPLRLLSTTKARDNVSLDKPHYFAMPESHTGL